jgi:ABC-2 type transport system ATP-binding protein
MIELQSLTKRYGSKLAVDVVTATIRPGRVTGFLGPNGAGKSTTMRMIVGLDRPNGGFARINGSTYAELRAPLHEVGVMLDAKAMHPGRTARNHLRAMAASNGISGHRVDEVIESTGLSTVARKRVRGFSLGMGQRLGIAAALLGDPGVLILDEPVNGLDPEGVLWVRRLARQYAAEGRTVLLSSHLMSEMEQTADDLIVLGRGRVLADAPMSEVLADASRVGASVRTPTPAQLAQVLSAPEVSVAVVEDGTVEVAGIDAARISELAARAGVALHQLTPLAASLEDAYLALTQDDVEYSTETHK